MPLGYSGASRGTGRKNPGISLKEAGGGGGEKTLALKGSHSLKNPPPGREGGKGRGQESCPPALTSPLNFKVALPSGMLGRGGDLAGTLHLSAVCCSAAQRRRVWVRSEPPRRAVLFLGEWGQSWAGSASGSLTGLPQPEVQWEDGGNRRPTSGSRGAATPCSLNGPPASQAPQNKRPESYPLPSPPLHSDAG